jgi:hypothetical protein
MRASYTNDFTFSASSSGGAKGDVVAMEIGLDVQNLSYNHPAGLLVVGCYNPSLAQLLDSVEYSATLDELTAESHFYRLGEGVGPTSASAARGFALAASLRYDRAEAYFNSGETIPLVTLFFRLIGDAGQAFDVRFCDDEFVFPSGSCVRNNIFYNPTEGSHEVFSTTHASGRIDILSGPAAHPNPPTLPPDAKVYPTPPTPEEAEIQFELSGSVASPGDTAVPMSLYVTSNFEFSGYSASIVFPPELLTLQHIEDYTRRGFGWIDQTHGTVGFLMDSSYRRLGGEGERVRLATFYFDVNPAASGTIAPAFENRNGGANWLAIRSTTKEGEQPLPFGVVVEPITLVSGLLRIQSEPTIPGDVNVDTALDLTDPLIILSDLFQGTEEMLCSNAADFNSDAQIDIADPIAILRYLFQGSQQILSPSIICTRSE